MATFSTSTEIARPVAAVFGFLGVPANLPKLVPPDVALELIEAPEVMAAGARLVWKARRWGVSQRIVMEVTALEADARLVLSQAQGPFARWVQTQTFEAVPGGTRLSEVVEFEPPRGMLGRLLTEAAVRADLEPLYAYRAERLRALLK